MFRNKEIFRYEERKVDMRYINRIFDRATVRGIADYLLFGIGPDEDNRSYEERLDEPYERFKKAVAKYDKKHNSELLDLSNEITSETASVYTEIGLQAGLLLMKDIIKNIGGEKSEPIKASRENTITNHPNKALLEGLYKEWVENSLQEILHKDKKYQIVNEETRQKIKDIDKIELKKGELEIIDRALSATNKRSIEYGRVSYRQGFLDAVSLLQK